MAKKRLLLLGSIVSACPPEKYGGSERVAYYQAKQLAKRGVELVFVGAKGTEENFKKQLTLENESEELLAHIEFVEIGGGTQLAETDDSIVDDVSQVEASRKLRREMVHIAELIAFIYQRQNDFDVVLNNMRGVEAVLVPVFKELNKKFLTVLHLNLFDELASLFRAYNIGIIPISEHQKKGFEGLNFLETIPNPMSTSLFKSNIVRRKKKHALFIGSMGKNKNPLDAILASKKAEVPLVLAGKISDQEYFDHFIKPHIDGTTVEFRGEIGQVEKMEALLGASVFLFPVLWDEPFGLVVIEALAAGVPVIAYPHGGPAELIKNNFNGYLVHDVSQMVAAIKKVDAIRSEDCISSVAQYDEEVIGEKYYSLYRSFKSA